MNKRIDINKAIEIKKDIINLLKIIDKNKIALSKSVTIDINNLSNDYDYSDKVDSLLNKKIKLEDYGK